MTPSNEGQTLQNRGNERKTQIMRAALKIFALRGIVGTKTSMIAAEACVSEGLLYRYFTSKDELFTLLVKEAAQESVSEMANLDKLPGSPIEKIRALTKHILDEDGQLSWLLMHQARTSDGVPEEAKQLIKQFSMNTYVDQLEPLFIKGQNAGEIVADDPRKLISCFLMVLTGLMTVNIKGDENYQPIDIDLLMRIITKS
ncbi:TetR/AcrR family transcriptional regulator [Paenibacillus puerhi]|uniref:TetR/AcrR family transcriptional regulator n=1 Tax=Paenibacillus puerhi TaxID=2692622 RepID=UPI00135A6AFE|nr:TetR/AcrR family transcriptional regulator [Paenibacillus puerhi]